MPRYFFDVNDGSGPTVDGDGVDCETLDAARRLAVREVALTIRDEVPNGERRTYVVTVRNAEGTPVYVATATLIAENLVQTGQEG